MAVVQITDLLVKPEFTERVQQLSIQKSALFQSGIIANDPIIAMLAKSEGSTFTLPYWNDISGGSSIGSDDPTAHITAAKIGMGNEKAVKMFRANAWSSMDLTKSFTGGDDPLERIAQLIAEWWRRDQQVILIDILTGVFNSALASTHVLDVTGAGTALTDTVILDAKQLLGDAADTLSGIVMHSAKFTALQKKLLVDYVNVPGIDIKAPSFLGYQIIIDDSLPVDTGNYTSYLFGPGAIAYGEGTPKMPMAHTRDETAGNGYGMETLVNRREFIMHPRGLKWTSNTMVNSSPSNAELATGANWARAWDAKKIKVVKILSK